MKSSPRNDLRLVYDTERGDLRKAKQPEAEPEQSLPVPRKKPHRLRVILDTKQRRGKAVTVILDIPHNPQAIAELAAALKRHCGAGGTVKGKNIEIQGDHRAKIVARLKELGYDAVA